MRVEVHPTHPQARLIELACDSLRAGGVIVYPTDSCYALGCALESHGAVQRIRAIRQMGKQHYLTLVCRDLSELATFARVDNACYRLIKSLTPGPYTFILQATRELPRRLHDPKRKAIGLRIPRHRVSTTLLQALGTPMLSATAYDESGETPLADPDEVQQHLGRRVELFLDAGPGGVEPTTVIDLSSGDPVLVRKGLGAIDHLLDLEAS
ncbi:MAG: threonylcarbamoyl-AMP synthase [Proteobacteria bacterium]|nr:MAG: threonylcarbamoyl-AMP synthase [Pseudomonadota bacterium]